MGTFFSAPRFPSVTVFYSSFFPFSDENDVVSNYFLRREKRYGLLSVFNSVKESMLPTR